MTTGELAVMTVLVGVWCIGWVTVAFTLAIRNRKA